MEIKQYNIYEVNISQNKKIVNPQYDIVYGVILSPDVMNNILKTVIIAPLCNQCAITPTTFLIDNKTRIQLDRISTINKTQITKFIAPLDNSQIPKIKNTINEMLVK